MEFREAAMMMNNEEKKPLWEKELWNSSSHCCCVNVYQGDIHHPHFLGDFAKKIAMPLPSSFATNPFFCIVYWEGKGISAAWSGGMRPCPWSCRSFPTQTILGLYGCRRVWNLGSSVGPTGGNSSLENPCLWQKELFRNPMLDCSQKGSDMCWKQCWVPAFLSDFSVAQCAQCS